MPGIVGIVSSGSNSENRLEVDAMIRSILHEKFYVSGTLVHQGPDLCVGWVADAGSFSDCLPIWNEEKNICLIFSGEDYRDRSEIDQLRTQGHQFNPENASYLVHLYEELGVGFLAKINGWFAGLLVDLRNRTALLFNDRYGLGRICYHQCDRGLYFASEAKALLKVLPNLRSLDHRSLGEFLSCGCVLQSRTLFSDVSVLPGGSVWTFSEGKEIRKDFYFQPHLWEEQPALSESDYCLELKETWKRILPTYFREGEKVALSLTGGVDSRMILAWAPRPPGELPCYTFGGRYRDCNDVKLGRQLAKISQQPHHTIPVNGEFLSQFPALAEKAAYISEGSIDSSSTIDLFVQRKAREIAPARITGTNGGEILRRLVMFKPGHLLEDLFDPEMTSHIGAAEVTYAEELNCHKVSFAAFKQTPWHMNPKFAMERSQITLRLPFCDNELVRLSYQAPPSMAAENAPALRVIEDGNPALSRVGTDRSLWAATVPGIGRVRQFTFTFRAEYAYDYGMPQWLARADHFLTPLHLDRLFLGRHKFHHFRVFYRDELSRYVREVLLDSRTLNRSFISKPVLEEMVRGHLAGYRNYTIEIHKLLTLELMQRQLIDQN